MKVTFIGGGNMATAIAGGLVARGMPAADIRIVEPSATQRERLAERIAGVALHPSVSDETVSGVDVVVLAVKPQQMREAASALAPFVAPIPLVLSIAAGVRCRDIARWLGGYRRIVRAMPNTPALVGEGISAVYAMPEAGEASRFAVRVLEACGEVISCEREDELDAVTAVSGSGPAYVFYFLEALEEAAIELGLPADVSRRLALATFDGSIALARKSPDSPATLRANVTSKGGTTARALDVLDRASVRRSILEAVKAAAERARELGDEFGRDACRDA
jgi:pyrroline-5-carboxylate reductase